MTCPCDSASATTTGAVCSPDVTRRVQAWLCELGRIEELESLLIIFNDDIDGEETVATMLEMASTEWMNFADEEDEVADQEGFYYAIKARLEEMLDEHICVRAAYENSDKIATLLTDWYLDSCH